ncbi:hypothetical protein [Micrococcus terreus]|uniref:hypothetical protein n=1 Tax=Micrococcus terreus TaxID=574650 RepID=UPI003019EE46
MNVKTAVIVLYAVLSLSPWALVPLVPVLVVDAWAMLLAMLLLSLVSAVLTWGMVTTGVSRPGASRVGILALSSLSIILVVRAGALSSREDDWTGLLFLLLTPLHGALALWIALHARRAGPMAPSA